MRFAITVFGLELFAVSFDRTELVVADEDEEEEKPGYGFSQ